MHCGVDSAYVYELDKSDLGYTVYVIFLGILSVSDKAITEDASNLNYNENMDTDNKLAHNQNKLCPWCISVGE